MVGKIMGTGSCVPELVWDNNKLAEIVDTSDEWIRERTGVARRHIAGEKESTAYMASQAAKAALEDAKIQAGDIDLIIAATISPDNLMPCLACEVQKTLEAKNATCFDLNAACTGFLFALNTAQAYLSLGIYRSALVIGAERLSDLVNWSDRSTCVLFGDGAGAVVLKASETGTYLQVTHSQGSKGEALVCASRKQKIFEQDPGSPETFIRMDGREVFKFAVSKVPEAIRELMEKADLRPEDVDYYLLHQANARIVRSVARRLGEGMDKFPLNMEEYGNTSSASIPILLDELKKAGKLERGSRLILSGFGGGLSYGASLIEF